MSSRDGERGLPTSSTTAEAKNDGVLQRAEPAQSPHDAAPATSLPAGQQLPSLTMAHAPSQSGGDRQALARPVELPPIASSRGGPSNPSASTPRSSAGFSAILNPTEPDAGVPTLRRKASHLDSPPSSATPQLAPITSSYAQAPSGYVSSHHTASPSLSMASTGDRAPPRRILTPRSPSIHRAVSLNQLNSSTGSINAQHSPFPISPRTRPYTIEPGVSGAPPLPTPPAAIRQAYGFPAPTPASQTSRRTSAGAMRMSESTSPRSSYSPFSQAGGHSPGSHYTAGPPQSTPAQYNVGGHNQPTSGPGLSDFDRQRVVSVPISSSMGRDTYQMMTLETTSGTVQLPVDVQAASRVADEKRRRNAGASARFRQRRKEKEKESSVTISRLEQQLKELSEDAEFYKKERDTLKVLAMQLPNSAQYFPRPESPRILRRLTERGMGPSSGASNSYAPMQDHPIQSPGEGRNVRRRTSTFSLPPPPPPPASLPHPASQPSTPLPSANPPFPHAGFVSQHFPPIGHQSQGPPPPMNTPLPPQQSHPMHPSMHGGLGGGSHGQGPPSHLNRNQLPGILPGPPQLMQASPQTGPYNPYATDRKPPTPRSG